MRDFANLHASEGLSDVSSKAGVALIAGAGLAWLGPFGTVDQSVFVRLGFWVAMSVAWFALSTIVALALSRSARLRQLGLWEQRTLTVTVTSLPGMAIAGFALVKMQNWQPDPGQVIELYAQTMLVGSALELICFALLGRAPAERMRNTEMPAFSGSLKRPRMDDGPQLEPVQEGPPDGPSCETSLTMTPAIPLLRRISPEVRGEIVCLQMEDHYVRIHTAAGSALVLMRFSDAIYGLGDVAGLRVHRSWWVARAAVKRVDRRGRTAQVLLTNGLTVPVSQPYLEGITALNDQSPVG